MTDIHKKKKIKILDISRFTQTNNNTRYIQIYIMDVNVHLGYWVIIFSIATEIRFITINKFHLCHNAPIINSISFSLDNGLSIKIFVYI